MDEARDNGQQPARERSCLSGPNVDTSEKDKRHVLGRICKDGTSLVLNDSASESGTSDTRQQVELVVAIVRAEGLTDGTPTGRKKGKHQGRYFRVSVLDVADGNHPLTSADTSPFCAKGPEFSWGSGEGTGEEVRLLMKPMSFKCGVLLEIKMVRRESAGDDLLLGCSQMALKDISSTANGDSYSHRLHLTLDGNPKGTIEICISMRMKTSSVFSDGSEELDSGSGNDFIGSPLNRKHLQTQPSDRGEQLHAYAKGKEGQGTKAVALSQTRYSKWRIPYILNLTRSAFNTRMKHAKKLTASGLETAAGEETNQRARDDAMHDRNEDKSDVEHDNDGQPTSDDKVEEDAPREHTLTGERNHGSIRDILSTCHDLNITESLRDNLTGGNEALRTELEQTNRCSQDEGDGESHGLEGILRHDSSKYRRGKRTDRSPLDDRTRQSKDRPNISHCLEGEMSGKESAIKPREQEAGTDDARSHASDSSDSVPMDNDATAIPLAKRNETICRRKSFPPKDGGSLLRSFLQPTTPDIDASEESEGDKPSSASDGIPLDANASDVTSEIKRENVSTTNNVSSLDVAESMKAKTTRSKAKTPSTLFTVKGFRWSRRKNNGGRNRNKGEADSHISQDALTDSVDQLNPSTTPAYATSVEQTSVDVSGDVPTTASPTAAIALLITVFCASNLPDKSTRNIFGRKKQNIAQDSYVRFKVCDVTVATSAVKGGGSECTWGNGKDGEVVEISVPSELLLKDERIGSIGMYLELWSKASEEREKDVILGSAELPLIDWIGRRSAWAELDVEGNRTSRVKLSVRVKDFERGDLERIPEASIRSKDEISERIGVGSEENMVVDASSFALNDSGTGAMKAAVDNLSPPLDLKESRETPERSRTLPTIDEDRPHDLGLVPMTNSNSGIIPEETNVMEQKSDHSPTDCGLSEVVSRLNQSQGSDAPISQKQGIGDLVESGAAAACDSAMGSLRDFPQRGGVPDTPDNDASLQQFRADPSGTPAVVNITVRVRKADSLVMPVSKTPLERVENSAFYHPYVVLNVCGSKQSTSAVIGGGPKCRWSGEHEGIVVLSVSYEDLLAAGWGHPSTKDPELRVEVWNQMSTCRTADTFIGSTDVRLEDVLDNGARWISIVREKTCTGRVKIDAESPDLRQSKLISRNSGATEANEEKEGGERKTGHDTHEASLEEDGPEVFVKGSVEGSSGIENTIFSTEEGADIPTDTQLTSPHHHSDSTLVNSCTPSPAVKQRSPLISKVGANGQPPLIHPQDGRAQAQVVARTLDDATISHKEVPLGAETDGAFEGLRRRQQGGTAKVLDLAVIGAGTSDIATSSTGANTPRLLSTRTREQETTLSGMNEMSGDERLRKRDRRKSWNNLPSGVADRHGSKSINQSCIAQYRAPESRRKLGPGPPDSATRGRSSAMATFSSLTKEEKVKRLARAREISRRRRGSHRVNKGWNDEYLGHGSIQPSSDIVIAKRVHKAVTIQSVFRRWLARRILRRYQRAAANIQAAFRGYRERRHVIGLQVRTERAREEEQRARDRRSRIASKQQELYLLRSTPAQQLAQVDVLRASAMASRIQRVWRRLYRGTSHQHLFHSARQERSDALGDGWIGHEGKTRIKAPEIKWLRSNRAPAVGLTLEALRQRVALRQRTKEGSNEAIGRYKTCWYGMFDTPLDNDAGRKLGTIENTYESLIKYREQASRLVAALHRSEKERASSTKRRSERLANFRRLQDQLLHPPKINYTGYDNGLTNMDVSLTPVADVSRQLHGRNVVGGMYGKWQVSLDSSEQRRGETAHARAMAKARRGNNKWWAVSLPTDVGYNELVDVRKKNPSWATTLGHEERGRRCPGGVACHRGPREAPKDVVTNRCEYDSDEASLWWYTYASTEAGRADGGRADGGRADGQRREDIVFTELLERVKTNMNTSNGSKGTWKRKEQHKKEERERRLRISRKSQRIVDEVLRQQGVAHYSGRPCLRGSVTTVQRGAVIAIQRRVRGVLQRKKTALLRAEMRVFVALQALISELRRPELEHAGSQNHLLKMAGIFAEHSRGERPEAQRTGACSAATRRAVPVACSAVSESSASAHQPSSASAVPDEVNTAL